MLTAIAQRSRAMSKSSRNTNTKHGPHGVRSRLRGGAMLAASLMLAGCATGGYPSGSAGYPNTGYPGSDAPYPEPGYPSGYGSERLLGTVQDIDLNQGRLMMTDESRGSSGSYGGSRVEVYFDRNTQLVYQGRAQSIEGLERGDRISVDIAQSQGRLWARRIEVVQNVRDGSGGNYYGGELSGAVSVVDPRRRLITITRGGYSGDRTQVYYDERTQVEYRGQTFRPEQLDPGDVIRIQARPMGNNLVAEHIWVEVDARTR
jgi:hypothetical protein